jgi:outer membrane usher protein
VRRRKPLAAVALLTAALALPAHAQAAAIARLYALAGGDGESPQPVFLDLTVNTVHREAILVELTPDDVWAAVEDLSRAGLVNFRGARRSSAGRELVSLRSLGPELTFELDEVALGLRLTASAALLGRSKIDLAPNRRPEGAEYSSTASGFLNYAGRLDTLGLFSGAAEAGFSLGHGDLLQAGLTVDGDGNVLRGLTAWTLDRPEQMVQYAVGDLVAGTSGLGGGAVVLGAGVARDFSLDPYFVQRPLPDMTAFASTPSTVEVWVNGRLARQEALAPGTYDLWNLPVVTGANDVRVVVKDAFGRTDVLETAPYLGSRLLARGVHDFALYGGVRRENLGTESFDYGDALVVARERYGFTDTLTAGARLEAGKDLVSGGASLSLVTRLGEVEAELAGSAGGGWSGAAALGAWSIRLADANLQAFLRWQSPHYANGALDPALDRAVMRAGILGGWIATKRLSFTGELSTVSYRDLPRETRLGVRASWGFGIGQNLTVSANTVFPEGRAAVFALSAIVNFPFGGGASGQMSAGAASDGTAAASAGIVKSMPRGPGYEYRVQAGTAGRSGTVSALVGAQASFARAEATVDAHAGNALGSLSLAGGVVVLEDRVFLTRPVERGFALVRVPGVAGVEAYQENQPIGRTDGNGDVLIPSIEPFFANRLSIADGDVPMDRTVQVSERSVIGFRRAGAIAVFPAERLQAITGRLTVHGSAGVSVPAGGTLRVGLEGGKVRSSPIGSQGEFWLEDLPAGAHAAEIFWKGSLCRFTLSVPESGDAVHDLGALTCPNQPRAPGAN